MNAPAQNPIAAVSDTLLDVEARLERDIPGELLAVARGEALTTQAKKAPKLLLGASWTEFQAAQQARREAGDHWRMFVLELALARGATERNEKALYLALSWLARSLVSAGIEAPMGVPPDSGMLPFFAHRWLASLRGMPGVGKLVAEREAVAKAADALARSAYEQIRVMDEFRKAEEALLEAREDWRAAWDAVDATAIEKEIHAVVFTRNKRTLNRLGIPVVLVFLKKPFLKLVARIRAALPQTAAGKAAIAAGAVATLAVAGIAIHHHHTGPSAAAAHGAGFNRH